MLVRIEAHDSVGERLSRDARGPILGGEACREKRTRNDGERPSHGFFLPSSRCLRSKNSFQKKPF